MRIRNWSKFQHFKDRRPPWVKLHREILDQRDIMTISSCSFRLLVCLWLLASEDETMEGKLPTIDDISFRIRISKDEITKSLQELKPWIDNIDNTLISTRYQHGPPETETYKPEKEKEDGIVPVKPSRPRTPKLTDEEWMEQIKANPAYEGIDIDRLAGKCQAWCMTKGKQITRARILNWLNREEKPMKGITATANRPQTFEEIKMENTKRVMMEFMAQGGEDARDGQKTICDTHG